MRETYRPLALRLSILARVWTESDALSDQGGPVMHAVDVASVRLLRYVVPKLQRPPVLIVAVARGDELVPGHTHVPATVSATTPPHAPRGLARPAHADRVPPTSGPERPLRAA